MLLRTPSSTEATRISFTCVSFGSAVYDSTSVAFTRIGVMNLILSRQLPFLEESVSPMTTTSSPFFLYWSDCLELEAYKIHVYPSRLEPELSPPQNFSRHPKKSHTASDARHPLSYTPPQCRSLLLWPKSPVHSY